MSQTAETQLDRVERLLLGLTTGVHEMQQDLRTTRENMDNLTNEVCSARGQYIASSCTRYLLLAV